MRVRFRLLGPVDVRADDEPIAIARRQERCLLGILLLEAGHVVPAERLVDLLWDGASPQHGRRSVQIHIARLKARQTQAGNISGVGKSENTLGHVYLRLGRYEEAMAHAAASLAISEQAGDRLDIAWAWMLIGDGHRGLGEVDQARELWQQALAEFERIDSSEAEQARQRLRDTDPSNDVPV